MTTTPSRATRILRVILGRHPDGTKHTYTETTLGTHPCGTLVYCHHEQEQCHCGQIRITGYAVEEVR